MLDNLKTDATIQETTDSLGGFGVLESGLYNMELEHVFITKSKGGATAVNVRCKNPGYKEQLWATSGKAKGGKNFYINKKTKVKMYLPGFIIANDIALLAGGKELSELSTEEKTIDLYDPAQSKEVPTTVTMFTGLCDKGVTLGIIKKTIDETALNDATGEYDPTGETRDVNEIDKVFCVSDGRTVAEIRAKIDTAVFKPKWDAKNTGVTVNRAKGTGTVAGMPAPPNASIASGDAVPTESLFGA